MKPIVLLVTLTFAAPALAQDEPPSLMERGAQMFLEGLMQEVEPRLDDLQGMAENFGPAMRGFVEEMGPALADLMGKVEDWSAYHPPEILPNGDIIIRRKPDETPDDTPETAPDIEDPIEL